MRRPLLCLVALAALASPAGAAPPQPTAPALSGQDLLAAIDVPLSTALLARYKLDVAALTATLSDPARPRYVRLRALSGLGILGGDAARDQITASLRADADDAVRAEAAVVLARAFAQRGDPLARAALQAAAAKEQAPRAAAALAEELSRLGAP